MIAVTHLYKNIEELAQEIENLDKEKETLVQIYTSVFEPSEAVELARQVRELMPSCHILGSSVNGVIFRTEQMDDQTLIVIEQYDSTKLSVMMLDHSKLDYVQLVDNLEMRFQGHNTRVIKMFFGNYFYKSHQFVEEFDKRMGQIKIAGGISGEICGRADIIPYVFDDSGYLEDGGIFCGLMGKNISVYSNVNSSHVPVTPIYKITKANGTEIAEIENQPALKWMEEQLGVACDETYESWEETANKDPLVRFQIILEGHNRASRFLRYNKETGDLCQYFSEIESGHGFRISYSSPARCVAECKEIAIDLQTRPVEHMFCYSCMFRKMYLNDCGSWELLPFKGNNVCGVFVLGELGYQNGRNELFNGSCVFSGIAENEKYLNVKMDVFNNLVHVEKQKDNLMDFVGRKRLLHGKVNGLYRQIADHEAKNLDYLYKDSDLEIDNILKYEQVKLVKKYNKLCLLKIENFGTLIGYLGREKYLQELKFSIKYLRDRSDDFGKSDICFDNYAIGLDSLIVVSNDDIDNAEFLRRVEKIESMTLERQNKIGATPFNIRFVVVCDSENLLEDAYVKFQSTQHLQSNIIYGDGLGGSTMMSTQEEMLAIDLIHNALANGTVVPYYQGIYNNKTNKIDKFESLMRIKDDDGNAILPAEFIRVAKKYRLYLELNLKMLEMVLNDFEHSSYTVSINLSALDIASEKFRNALRERISTYKNPGNLVFEILEDEYFQDVKELKDFIKEVRGYGVKVAIDDFGAGYSNMLEIVAINPDFIKIDGSIIKGVHNNKDNRTILEVISILGEKLSVPLIAEFVENQEIQDVLIECGVAYSQGFLFARPLPLDKIDLN